MLYKIDITERILPKIEVKRVMAFGLETTGFDDFFEYMQMCYTTTTVGTICSLSSYLRPSIILIKTSNKKVSSSLHRCACPFLRREAV